MKRHILSISFILLLVINLFSQVKICEGIVTDPNNSPLPGVSIMVKGTSAGTISDLNGHYSLSLSDSNVVLVYSYIGFLTEEVNWLNQKTINVVLTEDLTSLEEVVVVGYCRQKVTNVTGAVSGVASGINIRGTGGNNKRKRSDNTYSHSPLYYVPDVNSESYVSTSENTFKSVNNDPLSTFSIDVDKASYANVRRFLNQGQLPPADAVRVEEMVNYFNYQYPEPEEEHPIAIITEVSECPWQPKHRLLHVGMQAKSVDKKELPASNLVFLIDVSGSMSGQNKLPLLKQSMNLLVDNLREIDRIAIVVYAGAAGMVLPSTSGAKKEKILEALSRLNAGGSTAGGEGIKLAYEVAQQNFIKNGNNRIILATDGDFNVGASSDKAMEELIEEKRESGIYLTCLGYGMGNYKDSKLETLADKGNGNYAYIDNIQEAEKQLVADFSGTLFTVAKDVKIQIEFNPSKVQAYRLVGYENRLLNDEDFKDDTKDAGEIGAGQTVTALYEIIPVGVKSSFVKDIDELKYQKKNVSPSEEYEIATVKVRYKKDGENSSIPFDVAVVDQYIPIELSSENFRFSASVALFGMLLNKSEYSKEYQFKDVLELADNSRSIDKDGYKSEFVRLVKSAGSLR